MLYVSNLFVGAMILDANPNTRLQFVVQLGWAGGLPIVVELLLPDVETSLTTQDLNILLTKSRVYRQISDYQDNRLSKDVYTTQIILIINLLKKGDKI